ncbi:MAG: flagellar hook-length control protein FliK [Pseudomonadota bacterium]|nr:flagellar hook-length control protein FliK [Pseudomonadota bacterium]
MHTPTLPIQLANASANPAPPRANAAPAADNSQFSAALSRQMEQRRQDGAAAASQAPAAQQPDQSPANTADTAGQTPQTPAQAQAQAKPADGKRAASADERDDAAASADAAAVSPVTDMLALVASFNQLAAAAPAATPAPLSDPLAAAAAAQAGALPGLAERQLKADLDAAAGKAPAALAGAPGSDDKASAAPAPAVDAAARFSMKTLAAPAAELKPKGGTPAAPANPANPANPAAPAAPAVTAMPAADGAARAVRTDGLAAAPQTAATDRADFGKIAVSTRAEAAPAPTAALLPADTAPRAREAIADIAALKEAPAPVPAPQLAPLQPATLAMTQAAGAPAIAARVGTPAWDNQVGQKIVWMVAGKEQSASLTLNPPDMGPMQVVLSVTNDHATVTFSAAQPEVRQALENAMPKLREMLGESGISLGNATVNAGLSDQRQAQQGEQPRNQGGTGARFGAGADTAPAAAVAPRQPRDGGGNGLVDTFA